MEDILQSSESFARALKGTQHSQADKIHLAQQAWSRTSVILPHKKEFLLEWLCGAFIKSASAKDNRTGPFLDLEYWRFLEQLLSSIVASHKPNARGNGIRQHGSHLRAGQDSGDAQAASVFLRVPTIPVFTSLLQTLVKDSELESSETGSEKPTNNKMKAAKQAPTTATTTKSDLLILPSDTLLSTASNCFDLLSGPFMSDWFQPTLEQYTPLVIASLLCISSIESNSTALSSSPSSAPSTSNDIALSFCNAILSRFRKLIIIQPNQKKVFGLVAGKLFDSLVKAQFLLRQYQTESEQAKGCLESIGSIFRLGLFHHEHLQEFTAGLKVTGTESDAGIQSYQKQLFDKISTMSKTDNTSFAALDVLPDLLHYFVNEFRKRQKNLTAIGFDKGFGGMDNSRKTEFTFFSELYMLAKYQLPSLSTKKGLSEESTKRISGVLAVLNRILGAALDLNIYQSSNDDISKAQYAFLEGAFDTVNTCLSASITVQDGAVQKLALEGEMVLVQLDDLLLVPHLDDLWPTLLVPLQEAHIASLKLSSTLLETYSRSRQLSKFVGSLLNAVREYTMEPSKLEECPLLSREFLNLIPLHVKNHLPLAQAPEVLDIFVSELKDHTFVDPLELLALNLPDLNGDSSTKSKKRKLDKGSKSKESNDSTDGATTRSAEMVSVLLSQFLKGLRINATQQKVIEASFELLFEGFIRPILSTFINSSKSNQYSDILQERHLTPALRLHYALCSISTKYWKNVVTVDYIQAIVDRAAQRSAWNDALTLMLNRVLLQHVHLTLCTSTAMAMEVGQERLVESCKGLVQFTMSRSRINELVDFSTKVEVTWDGRLSTALGDRFLIASWQVQVNDWLDIVCRFSDATQMELIAKIIAKSLETSATVTTGLISLRLLNQTLLRSANFYEVAKFRPVMTNTVLELLSKAIVGSIEKNDQSDSSFIQSVAEIVTFKSNTVSFHDALPLLVTLLSSLDHHRIGSSNKSKKSIKSVEAGATILSSASVGHLTSLLSILHLLPIEYFDKRERNQILIAMMALDQFIQKFCGGVTAVRPLLLCRTVALSLMQWRNDAGVLSQDTIMFRILVQDFSTWADTAKLFMDPTIADLADAVLTATCDMVDCLVLFLIQASGAKGKGTSRSESAAAYLNWIIDQMIVQTTSKVSISEKLAMINGTVLAQICDSLVSWMERLRAVDFDSVLVKRIIELLKVVEVKTCGSLQKMLKNGGQGVQDKLIDLQIFKVLLRFAKLERTKSGASSEDSSFTMQTTVGILDGLGQLAKTLKTTSVNKDENAMDLDLGIMSPDLLALLSALVVEYIPTLGSEKASFAIEERTELVQLVLMVFGTEQGLEVRDRVLLKDAYLSMLNQCSEDDYEAVLGYLLVETDKLQVGNSNDATEIRKEATLIHFLDFSFAGAQQGQKRKIRRQISRMVTLLTSVLQRTVSVNVVVEILDMLASIGSELAFDLRPYEIGLILEAVTTLMSPATPLLLSSLPSSSTSLVTNFSAESVTASSGVLSSSAAGTPAARIFTALYHVLVNLARYRQEELVHSIPVFAALIQGIFHGFKSIHPSIAKRQQGLQDSLGQTPFQLLTWSPVSLNENGKSTGGSGGEPLPVECAENFARLMTALGTKGITASDLQTSNNSGGLDSISASGTSGGVRQTFADGSKAFGKHAPYILMEYFAIQSSVVASISQNNLRQALLPGLYALLDLCSEWERELMMVGLDATGKILLKGLYADYLKFYKYTGR